MGYNVATIGQIDATSFCYAMLLALVCNECVTLQSVCNAIQSLSHIKHSSQTSARSYPNKSYHFITLCLMSISFFLALKAQKCFMDLGPENIIKHNKSEDGRGNKKLIQAKITIQISC